jgi:hypothetical protein
LGTLGPQNCSNIGLWPDLSYRAISILADTHFRRSDNVYPLRLPILAKLQERTHFACNKPILRFEIRYGSHEVEPLTEMGAWRALYERNAN